MSEQLTPLTMTPAREKLLREGFCFDSDRDCAVVRELFTEITALRALKAPRLTREQVDTIRNLSFECYLPLDGFCDVLLTKYGIEVDSAPPEAQV